MNELILQRLLIELAAARLKHPEFPKSASDGVCIVIEESLELLRAVNDEEPEFRQIEEAFHIVVTGLRFIEERWCDNV